jgi:beta propeller domain-containing protein
MRAWRSRLAAIAALLALSEAASAEQSRRRPVTEAERAAARAALGRFTSPTLTRFGSDEEFRRYAAAVREVERTGRDYYYSLRAAPSGIRFAEVQPAGQASDSSTPVCPPEQPDCEEGDRQIMVTGSRVPLARNPSITNNQQRGVEEGDIVKQIDHYLLVLQDGRIFVVDIGGAGGGLRLTDRADVYRNPQSDMWYDEMLVFGDRILITGYTYDEGATEMAVFRLSPEGRLAREGVFRISSNDYYSSSNYATRLIEGNLVTYTPLRISDLASADFKWPVVRRWLPEDDARTAAFLARRARNWRLRPDDPPPAEPPLVDAAGIYRPVRLIEEDPTIHTVSVCPLASADGGRALTCRTTAFVGPDVVEWYVTTDQVFLWTAFAGRGWRGRCERDAPIEAGEATPALVYRVPVSGARPDLIGARGMPPDQFAMQADSRNLYALLRLLPEGCGERYDLPSQLAFLSLPLSRLGATFSQAPESAFTPLPATVNHQVASRFTDRYLVYGGLSRHRSGYPGAAQLADYSSDYRERIRRDLQPRPAYVVPIARPEAVRPLTLGHSVIRAERVADDIVLTGYRDRRGLSISLIDLDARPRVAATVLLAGRYESEGRSHAFNSLVGDDGGGLMGLPTVRRADDSDRRHWRSRASDLSFLEFDASGRLRPVGELERRFDYVDGYDDATRVEDEDGVPGYECQVSCIDWYGNSRPIFTDGRIFGLAGAELIEGRMEGGRIRELQRINIALPEARPADRGPN